MDTPSATLSVWPHPHVPGWDGRADTIPNAVGNPVMDALEAMTKRWPTDAHAPGYVVPGGDPAIPRLKLETLAPLIDAGAEPVIAVVFVDVDRPGHQPWASPTEAAEAVVDLLETHGDPGGVLEAAGVYTTRAGFRLVFRPQDPPLASAFKAWMLGNDGKGGFLGWLSRATGIPFAKDGGGGIDATCCQWTRCYRLPYVVRDNVPTMPHVDLSRFRALACPWRPSVTPHRDVAAPVTGTAAEAYRDGLPPMPGPGDVPAEVWAKVADHPVASKFLEKLRTGAPLAGKGSRDTALVRVIGSVVRALGSTDPMDTWRLVARSVAADVTEGAPTVTKAWEKCREYAKREGDRVASVTAAKDRPPVLYSGSRYYVLDHAADTYRPPVSGTALVAALEAYGPPGLATRGNTGTTRDVADVLADYGKPATVVIAEMGRARSVYDPHLNGGTLWESCCVLRTDVEPKADPQVARWLELLGGDDVDSLLDWLALAVDTSRPTAALYLEGPPGAGKGMLAAGVAALWGTGATSYDDATAAFNGALAVCPVVLIDEGISMLGGRSGGFSAPFRTLIAETVRPLRRKYMEAGTIVGCPRVIVAANNGDALRIRERLTAADVEAIAQRILYLLASRAAGVFLREIGGRTATADWVQGDGGKVGRIGQHIMWLRANRQVKPGGRFLVEGRMTNFHRDLHLTAGIHGELLSLLATLGTAGRSQPGILLGRTGADGSPVVLANAPSVRRLWAPTLNANAPLDAEVVAALRALAVGEARVATPAGKLRYYEIPAASVLRIADLYQIGDPDLLEKALTTPTGVLPMARAST